jgi:hypothetical protein
MPSIDVDSYSIAKFHARGDNLPSVVGIGQIHCKDAWMYHSDTGQENQGQGPNFLNFLACNKNVPISERLRDPSYLPHPFPHCFSLCFTVLTTLESRNWYSNACLIGPRAQHDHGERPVLPAWQLRPQTSWLYLALSFSVAFLKVRDYPSCLHIF